MKNETKKSSKFASLRQKAEELLNKKTSKGVVKNSEAQMQKLIYELELHQIELEFQSESLECQSDEKRRRADELVMNTDHIYNLLIIDDEIGITKSLFRQFRKEYNVFTANSAQDAIKVMENNTIQLVISDQRMPEMTGLDFFSSIKKKYPDTIKMMLSGYPDIEVVIGSINEGQVYKYITKPWNYEELSRLLKDAVEKYELITNNKHLFTSLEECKQAEMKLKAVNKELRFQNEVKAKRADELVIAIKELRQKAHEKYKIKQTLNTGGLTEVESLKLLHELEVHQIELEMQNEELQLAKEKEKLIADKYTKLYDFAPSGYFMLDREFCICELNFNGAKMLSKERSKLINTNFNFFITPDKRFVLTDFLDKVLQTKTKQTCELHLCLKDKPTLYVQIEAVFAETEQKYMLTLVDLSERKQVESEIIKAKEKAEVNEARFKVYTEQSPIAIYTTNVDGDCDYANETWLEMAGMNREQALGKGWINALHSDDLYRFNADWCKSVKSNGKWRYEYRFIDKNEKIAWVEGTAKKLFNEKNELVGYLGTNLNITERKLAKQALEESKYLLAEAQKLGKMGGWSYDVETKEVRFTDFTYEIYGKKISTIEEGIKFYHPQDKELVRNSFTEVISKQKPYDLEVKFINAKGRNLYVRTVVYPIVEKGKVTKVVGNIVDITERKKAEIALKESEYLLKESEKTGKMGGWCYDVESDQMTYTDNIHEIHGTKLLSADEGIKFYHPDDREIIWNSFSDAILKQKPYDLEGRFINAQGDNLFVRTIGHPIVEKGKVTKVVGNIVDITERKKAEQVLIDSELRFKQLIKNSFDMIALVDSSGILHFISESCEKILGYKPEELIGISIFEKMIHPEDHESLKKGFHDIIEHNVNTGMQYRHLHKNGSWVYLEVIGNNQLDNPEIKSIVINVRDITERKHAVQIIKENEIRLKDLNATKDRLFSIIAHDLRSPFNHILGFSELLIDEENSLNVSERKECLGFINLSAKHTLVLLDNLLNWAKSQTGQVKFKLEKVVLSSIIQEIFEFLNPSAKIKDIVLNHIKSEEIVVFADLNMIKTVLRNLISNAIKFTNSNGEINVYALQKNNFIEIAVSDNGVGMDEETRNKLFSLETNESSIGTANEKGSGLGLILCKEFVEKHGGKIWVESEPDSHQEGKGSVFKFSLPLEILNGAE